MNVAFYFFIRISIMTAEAKFKPVQSPRWALVSSALPNFNMKHWKSAKILSNFQNRELEMARAVNGLDFGGAAEIERAGR